jgi:hypothetical protein
MNLRKGLIFSLIVLVLLIASKGVNIMAQWNAKVQQEGGNTWNPPVQPPTNPFSPIDPLAAYRPGVGRSAQTPSLIANPFAPVSPSLPLGGNTPQSLAPNSPNYPNSSQQVTPRQVAVTPRQQTDFNQAPQINRPQQGAWMPAINPAMAQWFAPLMSLFSMFGNQGNQWNPDWGQSGSWNGQQQNNNQNLGW